MEAELGCLRRAADVAVVESADLRQRNDLTMRWRLDSTRFRRVFFDSQVRARAVIVADVIAKTMSQVSLVEDDDVVEEFASDGCPWPKLDLKAVDQTVARSALSAMALKNSSGQGIAAGRSVTAV